VCTDWILPPQDEVVWRKLVNTVPYFGIYGLINLLATSLGKESSEWGRIRLLGSERMKLLQKIVFGS
jgi:hypothetical protein